MDLAICFAVPILIVGLHYIVHTHRYVIVAIGGCTDTYNNSWPIIPIIMIWPLIFTLINVYYAGTSSLSFHVSFFPFAIKTPKLTPLPALVITRLRRHRTSISSILSSHSLNTSRFLRLFIMSLLLLLIYLPLNIYWFYANLSQPLEPYSWAAIHASSARDIVFLPALGIFTFDRYVPVAMSLFVFAFFGVGTEARGIYAAMARGLGLGMCFPRLGRERRPSTDGRGGWLDRLSLVAGGKRYFARFSSRGGSQGGTEMYVFFPPSLFALFSFHLAIFFSSPPTSSKRIY